MLNSRKCRIGACAAVGLFLCAPLLADCDSKSAEQYIRDAEADRAAGKISAAIIDVKNALQKDTKNVAARVLLARLYLDLPDPSGAEAELLRARQDGADASVVAKPLAEAELMLGKPQLAIKETEIADTAHTDLKASLLATRGLGLMATGDITGALSNLEAALKADPHSIDALAAMARYQLVQGDLAAARQNLAEAQNLDPENALLFSLQGAIAFAAGDAAASEQAFQQMLGAAPWSLLARVGIARAQIAEDKPKEAAGTLDVVLKTAPNDPNANYLRAVAAYRQQDYATAQQHLEKTLSRSNDFPQALMLAGATSYALKQYEQANTYLTQYVYRVPQNVQATKLLAAAQIAIGRPADAVKTLSSSAQNTDDGQLLAMIGEASLRAGDLSSGSRYLAKAVEKQPDNATLRAQLGATEVALGKTDAGIEDLQKSAEQDPANLRPQIALFSTYMRNKLYDKALGIATAVETSHPKAAVGLDLEGLAHLATGDKDDARKAFLKARQAEPGDPIALRTLASLEVADGQLAKAAQYEDEIIHANPKNIQAYIDLAEVERRENQPDQLLATLRKAVAENPDSPAARIVLSRILLPSGKPQDALDIVQPVLSKDPENALALEATGKAQLALQHADAALAAFKTLEQLQPNSSLAHRYLAEAYADNKNFDEAIAEGKKAIDLDPKDLPTALVLARIYMARQDFTSARSLLDKLTADSPNNASILAIEGEVAMAQGRADDAAAAYTLALDIADSGTIRGRLAAAEAAAGRFDDAVEMLGQWVEAHPDDLAGRISLGDLYLSKGRIEDAGKQYQAAQAKFPDNVIAENNLAWTLSALGRQPEALTHARHAAELAPNSFQVLDTLGVTLLRNQNATEALAVLQRATGAAPANPEIQLHLAQALIQTGDKDRARSVLENLLAGSQAFPERSQAKQLLGTLGG